MWIKATSNRRVNTDNVAYFQVAGNGSPHFQVEAVMVSLSGGTSTHVVTIRDDLTSINDVVAYLDDLLPGEGV